MPIATGSLKFVDVLVVAYYHDTNNTPLRIPKDLRTMGGFFF
jgi:hypothetical protein